MIVKEDREKTLNRIRRIQGQLNGIEKMIEEERFCGDILMQISAVRAALNKVSGVVIENYMKHCLNEQENEKDADEMINELIEIVLKYTK